MESFIKLSRRYLEVLSMSTSEADYRWLGIDVSKDHLDVYDLSQAESTRYDNDSEGVGQLRRALQNRSDWAVVCETSGGL